VVVGLETESYLALRRGLEEGIDEGIEQCSIQWAEPEEIVDYQ